MKRLGFSILTALLALGCQLTLAQNQSPAAVGDLNDDEMRGVVTEVDTFANTVTVEPTEIGKDVNLPDQGPVKLQVGADTFIQDSAPSTVLDELSLIRKGDHVRVEFEHPEDPQAIRGLNRESSADQEEP